MSEHIDQMDSVTMMEARVYVDGCQLDEHGWDAPKFSGQMSDEEILQRLDESYPTGAAGFASERGAEHTQYDAEGLR